MAHSKGTFDRAFRLHFPTVATIEGKTRPGDRIVAGVMGGWLYWFTGRTPALPYTFIPDFLPGQNTYFTPEMWRRLADELVSKHPPLLVLTTNQWVNLLNARYEMGRLYVAQFEPRLLWYRPH
jgi:hypothetical protein